MEKNPSHRLSSPKSYAVAAERFQNVAKIGFSPEIHPHRNQVADEKEGTAAQCQPVLSANGKGGEGEARHDGHQQDEREVCHPAVIASPSAQVNHHARYCDNFPRLGKFFWSIIAPKEN